MEPNVRQSDEDSKRYLALQEQQDKQGRAILVLEITVSGMQNLHEKLAELPIAIARIEERVKGRSSTENGGLGMTKAIAALAAALAALAGTIGAGVGVLMSKVVGGG